MSLRTGVATAASLLMLLLAGCATTAPSGTPLATASSVNAARWQARRTALTGIDGFALQARVAASGSFGVSGDLSWRQSGGNYTAHFSGPFGAGAVDIAGDPFVVDIRTRDKRYVTSDPEDFLLRHFGWTLPILGLRYWVLGLPAPGAGTATSIFLDAEGRLQRLEQDGWSIVYEDYQAADGYSLPHRFQMSGQQTKFRVIIDRWDGIASVDGARGKAGH